MIQFSTLNNYLQLTGQNRNFQYNLSCLYLLIKSSNNRMNNWQSPFHHNQQTRQLTQQSGKKIKNFFYHYCDLIGSGNFAKVYRGTNVLTGQMVAIKIVSLDSLKSKKLEDLIFEEIKILQQMNHPNILKFYEALMSDRNCYIITELCNQGDLGVKLKQNGKFNQHEIIKYIHDIFQGLCYLKHMKVTHRDLKATNLFLHNGNVKISDFGLAKFFQKRFHDLDIGSPLYMSPEGILLNFYSQKTDIWSYGVVIYELLHGQTPLAQCKSEEELRKGVQTPIYYHGFRRDLSEGIKKFITKLMEVDENKRPTIEELKGQPYLKNIISPIYRKTSQSFKVDRPKCSLRNTSKDESAFKTPQNRTSEKDKVKSQISYQKNILFKNQVKSNFQNTPNSLPNYFTNNQSNQPFGSLNNLKTLHKKSNFKETQLKVNKQEAKWEPKRPMKNNQNEKNTFFPIQPSTTTKMHTQHFRNEWVQPLKSSFEKKASQKTIQSTDYSEQDGFFKPVIKFVHNNFYDK